MEYAILAIAAAVAIVGWLKPPTTQKWLKWVATALLVAGVVFQVLQASKESKQKKIDEAAKAAAESRAAAAEEKLSKLEERSRVAGKLSSVILSPQAGIYPEFQIGRSGVIFFTAGGRAVHNGSLITTYSAEDLKPILEGMDFKISVEGGEAKVSTLVRAPDGSAVAELVRNEWRINPQKAFDRNFRSDALEVKEATGDVVFQIRIVGTRVQYQGRLLNKKGEGWMVAEEPGGKDAVMQKLCCNKLPDKPVKVRPMFKYPSDLHPGELAE